MKKDRKNWSKTEKLEIVSYSFTHGPTKASREFGVSITSINKWVKLYESQGEIGLENKCENGENMSRQELKDLRRENDQLKQIIAEKELQLRIQADLLKKKKLTTKEDKQMIAEQYISQGKCSLRCQNRRIRYFEISIATYNSS